VIGSPYNDLLGGTERADVLVGGGGKDRLVGKGGRDDLRGGLGADRFITTDRRADTIRGGPGYDRARSDRNDALYSTHRVSNAPFSDPCFG
jgi:Ca2+-binding RTX toxin-like protein